MQLQKAIEVGETYMKGSDEADPVTFDTALLLLIEAGKRLKIRRGFGIPADLELLPGETEATTPSGKLPLGGITIVY